MATAAGDNDWPPAHASSRQPDAGTCRYDDIRTYALMMSNARIKWWRSFRLVMISMDKRRQNCDRELIVDDGSASDAWRHLARAVAAVDDYLA